MTAHEIAHVAYRAYTGGKGPRDSQQLPAKLYPGPVAKDFWQGTARIVTSVEPPLRASRESFASRRTSRTESLARPRISACPYDTVHMAA